VHCKDKVIFNAGLIFPIIVSWQPRSVPLQTPTTYRKPGSADGRQKTPLTFPPNFSSVFLLESEV
jgi:hypothetical protein